MELIQRYVSKELTHFVGRHKPEQERFNLLMDIIKSGWLLHKDIGENIKINPNAHGLEDIVIPGITCFADIPINDLSLHMEKYSNFGLAFKKDILVEKGANPVYYLATNGLIGESSGFAREMYFKENVKSYFSLMKDIKKILKEQGIGMEHVQNLERLDSFLIKHIFAYFKPFDASKTDADEDNYYLEREWRIVGDVQFNIDDITRILIPERYGKKLREMLPNYYGQISFTE
ncbi:abortive infection system antitoxin AbiGi family protein [Oceanobacillus sp. Castelsardo]|uniref:abortive infection system antitoxin AbiGi family protein n=1 Tax=Oceanobacillus sp. Castelsardo TaxID=1851204 RepID=UPI000837D39A|nr:abortive infection system antitoxin AbiGi family protein [Oceanobacillus sp. Castelsardo]